MLISIVIPTYNSSGFIRETVSAIEAYVTGSEHDFEVIIVDDGSLDGTYEKLQEVAEKSFLKMTIVQLFTNRGQFHALMAGLAHASGDYAVTFDDDLEYQPDQIGCLLTKFNEEPGRWDVVIGVPESRDRSRWREMGSWAANRLNSMIFDKPSQLKSGCFRMMTKVFVIRLLEHKTANPLIGPLIYKTTRRITNVSVKHQRGLRPSNYTRTGLVKALFKNLQVFSEIPLRYVANSGIFISLLSVAAAFAFVIQYLTGFPWPIKAPGWTSLITGLCFFSGLILASVGFLGQYVYRILEEVNKTPNFQIRRLFLNRK